jgi:molybdopterin converting factor small subunit
LKVLFYGRLAEAIGAEIEVDTAPCTVAELRQRIIAQHADAGQTLLSRRARAFVGNTFVHDDQLVDTSQAIEFLPPVSGG